MSDKELEDMKSDYLNLHTDKSLIAEQAWRITELEEQLTEAEKNEGLIGRQGIEIMEHLERIHDLEAQANQRDNIISKTNRARIDEMSDMIYQRDQTNTRLTEQLCLAKNQFDNLSRTQANQRGQIGGWEDISSAPKDGTHILVYEKAADIHVMAYYDEYFKELVNFCRLKTAPTHWQPLPAAPKEKGEDDE